MNTGRPQSLHNIFAYALWGAGIVLSFKMKMQICSVKKYVSFHTGQQRGKND